MIPFTSSNGPVTDSSDLRGLHPRPSNCSRQLLPASPKGAYCWCSTPKRRTAGAPDRPNCWINVTAPVPGCLFRITCLLDQMHGGRAFGTLLWSRYYASEFRRDISGSDPNDYCQQLRSRTCIAAAGKWNCFLNGSDYICVYNRPLAFRKRCKNPNLDCHGSLYSGCHHQERINTSSRFVLRYYRISNVALFELIPLKSAAYGQ